MPLNAVNRAAAGVVAGDGVEVEIQADTASREITVPSDLCAALADERATAKFFDSLSYTHRKEWVRWIEEAKKPETRRARITMTVEALRAGKRIR